jgi:hypothetical protein
MRPSQMWGANASCSPPWIRHCRLINKNSGSNSWTYRVRLLQAILVEARTKPESAVTKAHTAVPEWNCRRQQCAWRELWTSDLEKVPCSTGNTGRVSWLGNWLISTRYCRRSHRRPPDDISISSTHVICLHAAREYSCFEDNEQWNVL